MSHLYFIVELSTNNPTKEEVQAAEPTLDVGLSNDTHHNLQKILEWNEREFRDPKYPDDVMWTLWETTIYDTKPIGVDGCNLLDNLDEHWDELVEALHPDTFKDLYALAVRANEEDKIVYIF